MCVSVRVQGESVCVHAESRCVGGEQHQSTLSMHENAHMKFVTLNVNFRT